MLNNALTISKNKLFAEITTIPDCLNKSYYPFLDGIRGIAIISVILRHVSAEKSWGQYIDGTIGIHLFFILSGFLITTLLLKEKVSSGRVSLKNFYTRRVLRIFPVAYLFILTLVVLNHIFDLKVSPMSFLTSVLYLKNFPIAGDWYTGHFWSLSVEEQFYILAPFVLVTNTNKYIKLMIVLLVAIPVFDYIGFNNIGIFYTNYFLHKNHFCISSHI